MTLARVIVDFLVILAVTTFGLLVLFALANHWSSR